MSLCTRGDDGRLQATDSPPSAIPPHLHFLVAQIHNATTRARPSVNPSSASYDVFSAPTFSSMYNGPDVSTYTQINTARQLSVTVIAEDDDSYTPSDLFSYGAVMGSQSGWAAVNNIELLSTAAGNETTLDMDAVTMMSPKGTNISYWGHWNEGSNWPEQWPSEIVSSPAPWPLVTTVSWGGADSSSFTQEAQGEQYLQLCALGGVSMFAASGDDGALGSNNAQCDLQGGLDPSYPSTSPYVTAVGSTEVDQTTTAFFSDVPLCSGTKTMQQLNAEYQFSGGYGYFACVDGTSSERAVSYANSGFMSGGGFSTVYPLPSYQQQAVQQYINRTDIPFPAAGLWNPANRGVPDIAVFGQGLVIIKGGQLEVEGGTSLSSPLAAALLLPLQDISLQYTGQGLGWLNPLLYRMWEDDPTLFNDITEGNNNGSREVPNCPLGGYTAAPGWDAASGLGSPNIERMKQYLIALYTTVTPTPSSYSSSPSTLNYLQGLTSGKFVYDSTGTVEVLSVTLPNSTLTVGEVVAVVVGSILLVSGLTLLAWSLRRDKARGVDRSAR
jgi:subtilase family serine protease